MSLRQRARLRLSWQLALLASLASVAPTSSLEPVRVSSPPHTHTHPTLSHAHTHTLRNTLYPRGRRMLSQSTAPLLWPTRTWAAAPCSSCRRRCQGSRPASCTSRPETSAVTGSPTLWPAGAPSCGTARRRALPGRRLPCRPWTRGGALLKWLMWMATGGWTLWRPVRPLGLLSFATAPARGRRSRSPPVSA